MAWDLDAYLARIGYAGSRAPTEETLAALHVAHMRSIPFEALSVQMGEPVTLAEDAIFEKFVARRRGGWCFEVNGMFAALLARLGFRIERLAARVRLMTDRLGPETHQLTLVHLNGRRWIADVGFGGFGVFRPIPLETGRAHEQQGERFRLVESPYGFMLQTGLGESWMDLYSFTLQPRLPVDYEPGNFMLQHDPGSIFVQRLLVAIATEKGRVIVNGDALTHRRGPESSERTLASREELLAALREHFGIELPADARLRAFL